MLISRNAPLAQLIDELDDALKFSIEKEGNLSLDEVEDYDKVRAEIEGKLEYMRDFPNMKEKPLIYHLDVAAMYPNIMLSNRLQPDAVVTEAECATCDYNRPGKTCDRTMKWAWRGEYFPAKRDEVNMIKNALTNETFPPRWPSGPRRDYWDLSAAEQTAILHKRLGDYCRRVYKKTHETQTVVREAIICQRENPFYINTVRDFRDRRYEYKGLHKTWKKNLEKAIEGGSLTEIMDAKKMIVLYDSLQLAHKCILNSFYGYVMRKGARWHSMEMGGITCLTGATIIQRAKELVDDIGRPLELDTDGIWCMLPGVFPEDFSFKLKNGKKFKVSYPCTMLNHRTHAMFTNHQFHELTDPKRGTYEIRSENSIFFELDGPYRAMILPSSKEEDKLLKKRYAVFEHDGSLAELKGFEVKRRGELQLIKDFQKQIFEKFLLGETLEECYAAVARIADQWLDVLFSKGQTLDDDELVDLIAENKSMSKTLAEYGAQKSTAITTAKRLAEFLGNQMIKDKGLACKFIISAKPQGAPVTERAVPVAIFSAEPSVKQYYLRRFLKDNGQTEFDLRSILDWDYYIERFGSVIQKLITIPAAMQKVSNPVPRVRHPDWLFKRVAARTEKWKQHSIVDMFKAHGDKVPEVAGFRSAPKIRELLDEPEKPKVPEKVPDPLVDYSGWLRAMRPRWREQRKQRKLEGNTIGRSTKFGQMGSMFSRQSISMASARWDVVSISPAAREGDFKLFISFDGRIHMLRLRIPRQFYINFKTVPELERIPEECNITATSRTLPRDHQSRHLFQVTVPEQVYGEEESFFSELLNSPKVDGVYEMNLPHQIRALIHLGSTCMLRPDRQSQFSRGLDSGFELRDLMRVEPSGMSRMRYLDGGRHLRYFWLYHGGTSRRHFFALFTQEGQLRVHIVDSAGLRQVPRLDREYADRFDAFKGQGRINNGSGLFEYPAAMQVDVKVHTTDARALKAIGKDLVALRGAKQDGAILTVHSTRSQSYFESGLGSIAAEMPMLMASAPAAEDELPALNWQIYSSRRAMNYYLRLSEWLQSWMELSEHYRIPFCNLKSDHSMFAADLDFARQLQAQDMVMWWTNADRPDLGGREEDNHLPQRWDEHDQMEISRPGLYPNVTFEVTLKNLALDAILQSAAVNEMEGSGPGSMAFNAASHTLDEYSKGTVHTSSAAGDAVLTSQVFSIVKNLARSWFNAKKKGLSNHSAHLADNFWRWVSSTSSAMHEPAIQRFLHGLMRKTLLQMLAEFKRLGSDVIFADFNRIFLRTTKPTAGSAVAYGKYLMTAVNGCELFKHVNLEIEHFWEYLLWMDSANFGGVICADPAAVAMPKSASVEMNWNIRSFLPPALHERFEGVIGGFIHDLDQAKRQTIHTFERTPMKMIQAGQAQATPQSVVKGAAKATGDVESHDVLRVRHMRDTINHKMTRRLLRILSEVKARLSETLQSGDEAERLAWSFPQLPGSYLKLSDPALEFIKNVCAVLSLAKEAASEVQVCKRNLLEFVGIREFAAEAEWRNPCEPFKLPQVICSFCTESRSFDLCRDADLLPLKPSEAANWRCAKCRCPYDRAGIEERLIDIARTYVENYNLQDLRCNKCGNVRADNLAAQCACSGTWGLTISRVETIRRLKSMRTIAHYHALPNLQAATEEALAAT